MSKKKSVVSLSEFKAGEPRLIESMIASGGEIILTQNGSATVVVQDYETYQGLMEALAMMKLLVQGEADIKMGRLTLHSRQFADLKGRLTPR